VAQSRALGETLAEIAGHHHPRVRITAHLAEARGHRARRGVAGGRYPDHRLAFWSLSWVP
jgi:hypothetical protein